MHAIRGIIRLGVALFVVVSAGCAKEIKPGVTYAVSIIRRGTDGKVAPQGPVTRVESVVVMDTKEIAHEDCTLSLLVRKTEYGRVTFDITFPDKTTQMVRIKTGETKEVLPEGQKCGVRIEVQECR